MLRRWQQAKNGEGNVVLVSGEPGIGKSRLIIELLERIQAEPHTCMPHFCSPHDQDSTLYPITARLEQTAGFRRNDTVEQKLTKLEALLAQDTDNLREMVSILADLLSIPLGERYAPLKLTPQKRKEKTLQALLVLVERVAEHHPALIVFEEAHWIDPTSLEFLDLLIDRVSPIPILLIVTFRPEFSPTWIGRPHVHLMTLSRLSGRQSAEIIAIMTRGKKLPKDIIAQVVDRTDGVPLVGGAPRGQRSVRLRCSFSLSTSFRN